MVSLTFDWPIGEGQEKVNAEVVARPPPAVLQQHGRWLHRQTSWDNTEIAHTVAVQADNADTILAVAKQTDDINTTLLFHNREYVTV